MKRVFDLVLVVITMPFWMPLLVVLALLVWMRLGTPVLFRQRRPGKNGALFELLKFRTMTDARDAHGCLLPDRLRLTRFGQWLRRVSLDELPELWNVLKGEMSLIGPRPNLPSEVQAYEPWHYRRLEVSPGITGLWQVSGRSDLSFDEMVLLDIYYIENWSPILDLHILLKTIPIPILGSGAY